MLFRSHYICIDSMFLIALVVGTAEWAVGQSKVSQELLEAPLTGAITVAQSANQICAGGRVRFQPQAAPGVHQKLGRSDSLVHRQLRTAFREADEIGRASSGAGVFVYP